MNDVFIMEGKSAHHLLDFFHVPGTKLASCNPIWSLEHPYNVRIIMTTILDQEPKLQRERFHRDKKGDKNYNCFFLYMPDVYSIYVQWLPHGHKAESYTGDWMVVYGTHVMMCVCMCVHTHVCRKPWLGWHYSSIHKLSITLHFTSLCSI